ncbi:unnamed protein product [Gongylonema pulchrum]|uniref:EF-hand domain-containing protein n=1 Tax=Gongylonema pulchrum TaxID=637853 RepID=A0A183ETP7_9BILA|nr:unnamed protein product [Gongylonema pulchrum]
MLKKADTLLRKLEEDRKAISNIPESIAEEDKKKEREKLMRVEDLINKLQKVQNMSEKNQEEFRKILQALDDDNDGVIDADLVLRTGRSGILTPSVRESLKKEVENPRKSTGVEM